MYSRPLSSLAFLRKSHFGVSPALRIVSALVFMCFALTIRAALFQCYAPDLHAYYGDTMNKLYEWNPALLRNFPHKVSVFAAATFNFGLRTVTFPHLDFANLAWGWCAETVHFLYD
jgi:hypothetical protein